MTIDEVMEMCRRRTFGLDNTDVAKMYVGTVRALLGEIDDLRKTVKLLTPDDNTVGQYHRNGPDTEKRAAYDVAPRTGTQRMLVLQTVTMHADEGMTDPEIAEATGLYQYSAAPRRNELFKGGWLRDSGRRRKTDNGGEAIVWTITPKTIELFRVKEAI